MDLKTSNAMRLAKGELQSARAASVATWAEANELARRYRDGERVDIDTVRAAEARAKASDAKVTAAARAYKDRRESFAPQFLERQAEPTKRLLQALADIGKALDDALAEAREIAAFATSHSLPVTRAIARAQHLARIAAELRSTEH